MTFLREKINNKGFMLVETLIVCVFVGVTLVFLFVQLRNIANTYDRSFTYNTTNALYNAEQIREYLQTVNIETLKADLATSTKGYLDITSCNLPYYLPVVGEEDAFKEYCNTFYQQLNVQKILFSIEELTQIKHKLDNYRKEDNISQKMLDFINYVPYKKKSDAYRISIEYKDGTFASIQMTGNGNTVFVDGTAVYYNPNTNSKCTESEAVSTTGTKSGCMKWYTFLDTAGKNSVKMILDHNTSGDVAWNMTKYAFNGMVEVKTRLEEDTAPWKVSARLITADEVAEITGAHTTLQWDPNKVYVTGSPTIGTNISYFYLDGASGTDSTWHTQVVSASLKSRYAWLYDYTYGCKQYGCNAEDNNTYTYETTNDDKSSIGGYWTSSNAIYYSPSAGANVSQEAWGVRYDGVLVNVNVANKNHLGVRPVIEIPKFILSE